MKIKASELQVGDHLRVYRIPGPNRWERVVQVEKSDRLGTDIIVHTEFGGFVAPGVRECSAESGLHLQDEVEIHNLFGSPPPDHPLARFLGELEEDLLREKKKDR